MSLVVRLADQVCEIRLASPPGNVLDRALFQELSEAVREHAADPHLKAFLFTAEGKNFSYGASVPDHVAGEVEQFLPAFHRFFRDLAESGVPTIAAVQGLCLGGAFELVAACNFIVADSTAVFGVPEIKLGVFPPAACVFLPWKLGAGVAEDLILTGRNLTAEDGARHGLVSRLCDEGALEATVKTLISEEIRPKSAAALRIANRAVRRSLPLKDLDDLERIYLEELMATRDANEGIAAFLEKRKPTWVDA
ncbi:MAG: enoyl-CoA hydratase/isomerase family protein [Planctomycetota bacterium]|jgi:cyclohexa-1,5-dienecarbonyl-CoA hydratase